MGNEMTCQELVELVTDYLEGELSAEVQRRFDEHLDCCTACTRYILQFRHTVKITGRLQQSDLSNSALDDLLEVFRDWKRPRSA